MGWRWRKVFRTGPVNTTVTTKGVGWSIGVRGLRYGISPTGRRYVSVGVPGTGLYWTKYLDGRDPTKQWRKVNMEQTPFGPERISLAENAEPRCATVLLLDVSSSMQGRPITELQEAVSIYRDQLSADDLAKKRVEIAVVTFGGTVDVAHSFSEAEFFQPPALTAKGDTPMAEAVLTGLRILEERKREYRQHGLGLFRPWVLLLTDGAPTDGDTPQWREAVRLIREGEAGKKFLFYGFGVENADMRRLGELAPNHFKLQGFHFKELFKWLSDSQGKVANTVPGTKLLLPPPPFIEIES